MEVTLNVLAESVVVSGSAHKDQNGTVDLESVDLAHLLPTCGSIMGNFLRISRELVLFGLSPIPFC